jgi:hypothetical protein
MYVFVIAAGMMAVIHLRAAWQRPRLAVLVSGILWVLYAVYEHQVASGVLCDSDCNIRVDLALFLPILALTTFCAYQAYMGRPGQFKVIAMVLGAIGLFVFAFLAEHHGHGALSGLALVGILAIGVYALKSKLTTNRS